MPATREAQLDGSSVKLGGHSLAEMDLVDLVSSLVPCGKKMTPLPIAKDDV